MRRFWETPLFLIALAGVLVVVTGILVALFLQPEPSSDQEQEEQRIPTKEEIILRSSAPPGAESLYTPEEEAEIIRKSSAPPQTQPKYTPEELQEITTNSSAP